MRLREREREVSQSPTSFAAVRGGERAKSEGSLVISLTKEYKDVKMTEAKTILEKRDQVFF